MKTASVKYTEGKALLTVKDVAAFLNCSPKTVYAKAARGEIKKVIVGRMVRFDRNDVLARKPVTAL